MSTDKFSLAKLNPELQDEVQPQSTNNVDQNLKTPTSSPSRTPNASPQSLSTPSPPKPDRWEELMSEYKNSMFQIHPRYEMPWVRASPGGTRLELDSDEGSTDSDESPPTTSNASPIPQSTASRDRNIPTWEELMLSFKNDGGVHPSYAMPWIPTSPGRTRLKLESDEESTDSDSEEPTHSISSSPDSIDPPRQSSSPTPQPDIPSPKTKEDYQKLHEEGRTFWWSTLRHGPEMCKAFFCTNVPPMVKPEHCGHTGQDLPDDFQPCDVTCRGRWCPCVRSYSGWDYWS